MSVSMSVGMSTSTGQLLGKSVLEVSQLNPDSIFKIFEKAKRLKKAEPQLAGRSTGPKVLGLLFFEPSTRTRTSFEMACHKIGIRVLDFDVNSSSITKGETVEDTALNVEALGVSALVVRHPISGICHRLSKFLKTPIINAGDGMREHPTQALLDAFTIMTELGDLKKQRVLIVGDIRYSRVARSNLALLPMLGAEVAVCGPSTLCPAPGGEIKVFRSIEEGLKWSSVCMLLRMQMERQASFEVPSLREYSQRFGLNAARLSQFSASGIIMHPGPFNKGVELTEDVLQDPRQKILKQVENGVYVRAALLSEIMGIDV